ncbi:MAG: AAA family ATPase [Candidatus Zixiibacteriota bacterium]
MDIASYSSDSRAVIKNAKEVAVTFKHPEIEVEHLLIAVVRQEGTQVESILNELKKSPKFVESMVEVYLKDQSSRSAPRENLTISPAVQAILAQAIVEKEKLYDALVEPEHILIAIFDPKSNLSGYVREKLDITKENIYRAIAESKAVEEIASTTTAAPSGEAGEAGKKEVSKTLRYCIDLTNQAAAGEFDPVIGRSKEIQQTVQILLRRRKNSPVLVGGPGVGKTAIVEGFAQAVVSGDVPKVLQDVKVLEVDMGAMIAGAKYKGEFEERFKGLIGEVVKSAGKIILFLDEVHTIVGTGGGGGDAANLLKPVLARGQIRLIGATTEEEYIKYLEKDKALERRFEKIKIEEPNFEDAVRIVKGVVKKYEEHHKITYKPEALVGAVKLAQRYLSERNLPDVALDVIDEAGSEYSVKEEVAKAKIPELEKQIPEIQKLLKDIESKDPVKDAPEFEKLADAYDRFARDFELLEDSWGHRLDIPAGGKQ